MNSAIVGRNTERDEHTRRFHILRDKQSGQSGVPGSRLSEEQVEEVWQWGGPELEVGARRPGHEVNPVHARLGKVFPLSFRRALASLGAQSSPPSYRSMATPQ